MIRSFLLFLIALSLAGATGPAFAAPAADCPMGGDSSAMGMPMPMPDDHGAMGCCTPNCAIPCPPAVLPGAELQVAETQPASLPDAAMTFDALPSVSPSATDPPPRSLA